MGSTDLQRSHKWDVLIALLLCASVLSVYFQVAGFDYIYFDDPKYVKNNPYVMQGITAESVGWAFTSLGYASNWHPLTWISHMLDIDLFGQRPGMFHVMNVLIHTLNSLLLFYLFTRMTGERWKSAALAMLFALHPLHVESVAWISERKDVLSTFFWMLTMLAYVRYVEQKTSGRLAALCALYALGLMAKPMLVTLPFVLLLLDFWPLNRPGLFLERPDPGKGSSPKGMPAGLWKGVLALVREKALLFALALASGIVTFMAQRAGNAVSSLEALPMGSRVANALTSYALYLWHTVWPLQLSFFYPYRNEFDGLMVSLSILVLVAISAFVLATARMLPFLVTGWLWYLGTLVPVIGFVQVGFQSMADRYTYVPLTGVFIMLVWGLSAVAEKWKEGRCILYAFCCVAFAMLAWACWVQAGYWKDSAALFNRALLVTRGNYLAHANLSAVLLESEDLDGAVHQATEALKIRPDYVPALCNLGNALIRQEKHKEALNALEEAVRLEPGQTNPHYLLGIALYYTGDADGSLREFSNALNLDPGHAGALNGMKLVAGEKNRTDETIARLNEELKVHPNDISLHSQLTQLYLGKGNRQAAISHFERALYIEPDSVKNLRPLALLYAHEGRNADAISLLTKVMTIDPDNPEAYYNLACLHARQGEVSKGLKYLEKAVEKGFKDRALLDSDPDLQPLKDSQAYKDAVNGARE